MDGVMFRVKKTDVLKDLPPLLVNEVYIDMNDEQFGEYEDIENGLKTMDLSKLEVSENLKDLRRIFQRGLSLKLNIRSGTLITEDMLTLKKPFSEIGWEMRSKFIGRKAIRDIKLDEHLKFEDVGEI